MNSRLPVLHWLNLLSEEDEKYVSNCMPSYTVTYHPWNSSLAISVETAVPGCQWYGDEADVSPLDSLLA